MKFEANVWHTLVCSDFDNLGLLVYWAHKNGLHSLNFRNSLDFLAWCSTQVFRLEIVVIITKIGNHEYWLVQIGMSTMMKSVPKTSSGGKGLLLVYSFWSFLGLMVEILRSVVEDLLGACWWHYWVLWWGISWSRQHMRIKEINFLSWGRPEIIKLGLLEIGDLIDVNGILDVSCKKMTIGLRWKITITDDKVRLSSKKIERMV